MPLRYTVEVTITRPRAEVWAKLMDPETLKHWMPGLLAYTLTSGTMGMPGAQATCRFQMGKRDMVVEETIVQRVEGERIVMSYKGPGVLNHVDNSLHSVDANTTRVVAENEFVFQNLMMKVMGFLMPGAFRKQSLQYLQHFKAYVEDGKSVLNGTGS